MEMKSIKRMIKDLVLKVTGEKRVSFRKPLYEIGLESLSFTALIIEIENLCGIEIADVAIANFHNLNAIVTYVKGRMNQ